MPHNPVLDLEPGLSKRILENPTKAVRVTSALSTFDARVAIPNHATRIKQHFGHGKSSGQFPHFGLIIEFITEARVPVFDDALALDSQFKSLITEFGLVTIRNAQMHCEPSHVFQKNIFPSLTFHVDRGANFENQYSLFYRNPNDPSHLNPRATSTLIISNDAARLMISPDDARKENPLGGSMKLFQHNDVTEAVGEYVIEHKWDAPTGTGEICMFDNRTVLHASYHRQQEPGYKIAVQYLY